MKNKPEIDTKRTPLKQCRKCTGEVRNKRTSKNGCCSDVKSEVDGLPVRCVGAWANDKIYYLVQYFGIFASGMKNKFQNRYYIELCSGPGRCSTRDGYEQYGTALTVLTDKRFEHITKAVFVDYDSTVVDVLQKRIVGLELSGKANAVVGDYNDQESIRRALAGILANSLSLCLIDPTDCSLPFDTIRTIYHLTNRRCDFIISYFDGIDLRRNIREAVNEPEKHHTNREKYEAFLGNREFFKREDVILAAQKDKLDDLIAKFNEEYCEQLKKTGLKYQDSVQIRSSGEDGVPFYRLVFATGNQRGIEFWQKATHYKPSGQETFFNLMD